MTGKMTTAGIGGSMIVGGSRGEVMMRALAEVRDLEIIVQLVVAPARRGRDRSGRPAVVISTV